MLQAPPALAQLLAPWARLYGDSTAISTLVTFVHVAALVVGGGLAIALDRSALRLRAPDAGARTRHLEELASAHRTVLASLAVVLTSGVAMLAADLDTFFGSRVFWLKMGLVVLLVANGGVMTRVERALRTGAGDADAAWRRLRIVAGTSIALWLALTLAGVALTSAS